MIEGDLQKPCFYQYEQELGGAWGCASSPGPGQYVAASATGH